MQSFDYNRPLLINELAQIFAEDFRAVLESFSDEHQVEVCEVLLKVADSIEKNGNDQSIYNELIDPLLVKHKRRMTEFSNRRLTDYMLKDSMKLFDLMRKKKIDRMGDKPRAPAIACRKYCTAARLAAGH